MQQQNKTKMKELDSINKNVTRSKYYIGVLLLTTSLFCTAQNAEVDALFEEYNNSKSPGIAISVNKDGENIYQKGYGMANLEYGIPITTKTKFHLASLSKQFTAFLILQLEDEGMLSLKDDVRKYIPELPDYGHTITIDHLLTHSSGLRDQWRLLELAGWRLDDVIKTEQIFKLIIQQEELNFVPGEKHRYSNSGYTLLAMIVEKITETSFADHAKKIIFDPLEMHDSFFYDDHEGIIENRAYSYKKMNDDLKKSNLNYGTVGPTSLFSTIEDMNKWAFNFKSLTIGNKGIFKSMDQQVGSEYARGQFVTNYKGFKMICHSGSDAGYRLYFARFPKLGYEFSLFANASYISAYDEILQLIDIYLQDELPKKDDEINWDEPFKYKDNLFITLSNDDLKAFEGSYYDKERKDFWNVSLVNDTLHCYGKLLEDTVKLNPVGPKNFKVTGTPFDVSINFKENDYEEPILEFRIPDYAWLWNEKKMSVNKADYVGSYYNKELDVQYDLIERENELYLTHQKLDDIKIAPINNSYFMSENRNFSDIRFDRNDSGEIQTFSVKTEGIESMTFSKK